jgi:C-terminal processing protease CtpA/Prc
MSMAIDEISPTDATPLPAVLAGGQQLTPDERRQIVRQARQMIEGLYVHLPLKRAMHAVDPVQRLRLLERRLASYSDRGFHDEMISIFIELRDLHTNYILPLPYAGRIASLPFRIEAYGKRDALHYIVTSIAPDFAATPPFEVGVEVTHWNGIPIDRAVALNGERNGGSNADAWHARGLATMTQRPMMLLAAPEEDWIDLTFVGEDGTATQRFSWRVLEPTPAATAESPSGHDDPVGGALGLDVLTEEVRRAQKAVFVPEAIDLEQRMQLVAARCGSDPLDAIQAARCGDELADTSLLPDVLQFRTVPGPDGDLGYIRIRTFRVANLDVYMAEVQRILALLPQNGLIIDVRGNGGGVIPAGEFLLQLFTPRTIEPSRLHFINTQMTNEVTTKRGYEPWHKSIDEAVETGTPFSDGLPLVPEYADMCNEVGQRYHGPVALLTDALCYSTTDIFAAGFQDHAIGPVIGTSANTGAGGANVWDYAMIMGALPEQFKPLPKQASLRVAIRRTTRVAGRAGDPIEDLGVVPDHIHTLTRRDLLGGNVDLIAEAAEILSRQPRHMLGVDVTPRPDGVNLSVQTAGLDRIDVYLNGRPVDTFDVEDGETTRHVMFDGATEHTLVLRAYSAGTLAACRKERVGGQ